MYRCNCNTKVLCYATTLISTTPKCKQIYLCTCACFNIVIVHHCSTCTGLHIHYNTYCMHKHSLWLAQVPSPVANNICAQYTDKYWLYTKFYRQSYIVKKTKKNMLASPIDMESSKFPVISSKLHWTSMVM